MWVIVWSLWLLGWPLSLIVSDTFQANSGLVYDTFFGPKLSIVGASLIGMAATGAALSLLGVMTGAIVGTVEQRVPAWIGLGIACAIIGGAWAGWLEGPVGALAGGTVGPIFGVMIGLIFEPNEMAAD